MKKSFSGAIGLVIFSLSCCGCHKPTNREKLKTAVERVQSGELFAIDARSFTLDKDSDLEPLEAATSLEKLNLDHSLVTDDGLVYLRGLSHLKHLSLSRTRISNKGLGNIVKLPLEYLRLDETPIGDAGLEQIEKIATLKEISLWKANVTDAGLAHLAALPKLEILSLDETRVTDAGIQSLAAAKSLKRLKAWKTNVTEAGAEKLQKALPGLKVTCGQ
ncbi:MAG: hypothetical protein ACLQNE_05640 [Thermoguttaceae bacterium]